MCAITIQNLQVVYLSILLKPVFQQRLATGCHQILYSGFEWTLGLTSGCKIFRASGHQIIETDEPCILATSLLKGKQREAEAKRKQKAEKAAEQGTKRKEEPSAVGPSSAKKQNTGKTSAQSFHLLFCLISCQSSWSGTGTCTTKFSLAAVMILLS